MTFRRPPPGDRELLHENGLNLEGVALYQAFIHETLVVVCEELRRFFQRNPRTREYRWQGTTHDNDQVETSDTSPIGISIGEPDRLKRWPYVVVKDVSGNPQDLWLGQRMGTLITPNPNYSAVAAAEAARNVESYDEQPYLEVGERLGGKTTFEVTLEIGSIGSGPRSEGARVSDLVLYGLVVPLRRAWGKKAFNLIPNSTRVGGEQIRPYKGEASRDPESVRTISFSLWTEWYEDFYYTAETVDDFNINRVYLVRTEA